MPLGTSLVAPFAIVFPAVTTTRERERPGRVGVAAAAGILAASAVLGALIVFARRDHASLFDPTIGPPIGAMLHVVISFVCGLVFAVVAAPYRGLRVLAVAFLISGVAWALGATVSPAALRYGNDLYAATPRAAVVHVVMALALAAGMRLARSTR